MILNLTLLIAINSIIGITSSHAARQRSNAVTNRYDNIIPSGSMRTRAINPLTRQRSNAVTKLYNHTMQSRSNTAAGQSHEIQQPPKISEKIESPKIAAGIQQRIENMKKDTQRVKSTYENGEHNSEYNNPQDKNTTQIYTSYGSKAPLSETNLRIQGPKTNKKAQPRKDKFFTEDTQSPKISENIQKPYTEMKTNESSPTRSYTEVKTPSSSTNPDSVLSKAARLENNTKIRSDNMKNGGNKEYEEAPDTTVYTSNPIFNSES